MSEQTGHTPLEAVQALESGAFRLGMVVRRVLAEHPDLPIRSLRPSVYVCSYLDEEAETTAQVEISARSVDGVHAWAQALGGEATITVHGQGVGFPFEHANFTTTIDDVQLSFLGTRRLSDDEITAWHAQQDQAAAEDPTGGAE